jgi:hypothetical protein
MTEPQEIRFRIVELKEDPGHWMITRVDADGIEYGRALRMPDGTFWEVAAMHFFPPGGGNYRVDLGAQITESDSLSVLESSYLDARRQAAKREQKPDF